MPKARAPRTKKPAPARAKKAVVVRSMGPAVPPALGERLRSVRRARGLTQEQLAATAGLKPETVSRVETGAVTPDLDTLGRLVRALEVPFGTVLDGTERLFDPMAGSSGFLVGAVTVFEEALRDLSARDLDLVVRMASALGEKSR